MTTRVLGVAAALVVALSATSCGSAGSPPDATPSMSASSGAVPGASAAASTEQPSVSAAPTTPQAPSGAFPVAGPFPASDMVGMQAETDVEFTELVDCGKWMCRLRLDVVAPEEAAGLPTVVLLQGGPSRFHERRNGPMIFALARAGAVVFVPSYRNVETGSFDIDETYDDIRCAVRYARGNTAEFGGDPKRVLVVGQSYGSTVGIQAAIEPDRETPSCSAPAGSGVPDALVGLGGFGINVPSSPAAGPPLWLVAGSEDDANPGAGVADRLDDAGFEVSFELLKGVTHAELFDPAVTPRVIEIVFEAAEALRD